MVRLRGIVGELGGLLDPKIESAREIRDSRLRGTIFTALNTENSKGSEDTPPRASRHGGGSPNGAHTKHERQHAGRGGG